MYWPLMCGSLMVWCIRILAGSPATCCLNYCAGHQSARPVSSRAPCLCCRWRSTASRTSGWRTSTRPWSRYSRVRLYFQCSDERLLQIFLFISAFISQVWPEVTDPEKFVYEDVAIATYLLVSLNPCCFIISDCLHMVECLWNHSTQTSWHPHVRGVAIFILNVTEYGSIDLSVMHVCDPTEINRYDRRRFSRKCHTAISPDKMWVSCSALDQWLYVCGLEGAVGGGASGERSGRQTVLCGPGLWERPAGPHTDQWRGELNAAVFICGTQELHFYVVFPDRKLKRLLTSFYWIICWGDSVASQQREMK